VLMLLSMVAVMLLEQWVIKIKTTLNSVFPLFSPVFYYPFSLNHNQFIILFITSLTILHYQIHTHATIFETFLA
jgi:hypothetical protein